MQNKIKNIYENQQYQSTIASPQTLGPFLVIGYFKLSQTINTSLPPLPLITIGVFSDYYNFLNLYITQNTKVELKYIHDTNNIIQKQSSVTLSNLQNIWICFGIAYFRTNKQSKFVYNTSSSAVLQQSTVISSSELPSSITNFDVCISCKIVGGVYNQFLGQYTSVKIIYDIDFNSVNLYSYFNEFTKISKTSVLNSSFSSNNYVQNSEYNLGEGFTCNPGFAFFEGVCINQNNCESLNFEPDVYESFEIGKFLDSTSPIKCLNCGSNCIQCTSNTICTQCRSGYKIYQSRCVRCSDQNDCTSSCTGQQVFDPINYICIDSFDISSQILYSPLISSRIINDNTEIDVSPSFSNINDIIVYCYINVDKNPFTLHSFLGGTQFTTLIKLKKQWTKVPKGYKKSVTFFVLFYGNGTPSNLQIKINSNLAILNNSEQVVSNKISCSGSDSLTQSMFKVKFSISDNQSFFNLEIQSSSNSWGIRNLNIDISKCHPTCDSCKLGGSEDDCFTCKSDMIKSKSQCTCTIGNYSKYLNCFESPCVACTSCASTVPNCLKCEDITGNCTQCKSGFTIKDGLCVANSTCNNRNAIFLNYCGVSNEDGFIHFKQNRVLQYSDYWKFQSNNLSVYNFESKNYLPIICLDQQHTLTMNLPDIYPYHYKVGVKITILAFAWIDPEDFAVIYADNNNGNTQIHKRCYKGVNGKVDGDSMSFQENNLSFNNANGSLYFKFVADTNQVCADEGYTFTQVEFIYYRCNPLCKTCTSSSLASCTNCIDNAQKVSNNCQCNDGYYFSLLREKGDTNGRCLKCNSACKTCTGPSYQDCNLCTDGYIKTVNDICQYCAEREFWSEASSSCLNCHSCCYTCTDTNNLSCTNCNSGYTFNSQDKSCYKYNSQCQSCTVAVNSLCGGDQNSHDNCYSNGWRLIDANTCVNCKIYVNDKCGGGLSQLVTDYCIIKGFYSIDSNNCSSCDNVQQNNCGVDVIKDTCFNSGWDQVDSQICKNCNVNSPTFNECACHYTCATCTRYWNPKVCLTCSPSFYFFEGECLPKCPNGYIISGQVCVPCKDEQMPTCVSCYKTCLICSPFEVNNISNSCTRCSNLTRIFDNGKCKCIDGVDNRQIFYECSYQNIAVLNAILSNTSPVLTIDFGRQLKIPNNFISKQNTDVLCGLLFIDKTTQLLSPKKCSITDNSVVVDLSVSSQVFNGDFVYFQQNILSFESTPQLMIDKYMNNVVIQDKILVNSKVQFNWSPIENSCSDFKIEYNYIINDAQRGFKSYLWSVGSFIPENHSLQSSLEVLLQKANTDKSLNIIIPKGIVKLGSSVKLLFKYILKANVNSFEELPLSVKAEKKVFIYFQSFIVFPLLRYQNGLVDIQAVTKICLPDGDIVYTEPIDFSIVCVQYPDINYANSEFNKNVYTVELQSYKFPIGNIILNVNAKLISNPFIDDIAEFKINSQRSELLVQIIGGNCFFNYQRDITIQTEIRDLDIEKENDPQEIDVTWDCQDITTKLICQYKDGSDIIFPPQSTANLKANTFYPYTVIKMKLTGVKSDGRSSSDSIIVILSELDLPPLRVVMNLIDPRKQTVNENEEIYVTLSYSSIINIDLLSFSGTISYENEVVGIIKIDYTELRFQIWYHFSKFKRDQKEFQIRFNVFNPKFYMPSVYMKNLNINFPPNNCKFGVSPKNGGYSIETQFMILFEDCEDENKPIYYQFFFYRNSADFELEKKHPLQVLRRQITDKQKNSNVFTSLPPGKILILGQAIDSKNAVYNSTVEITVEKKSYDEQFYLSIIQQKLDQVNKVSANDAISDLSVLCQDILQRPEFQTSSQLNEKKIQIIIVLNKLQKTLLPLSLFSTVVDKAIQTLIKSGIKYNQSQQLDLLNKLIENLEESANLQQKIIELSIEKLKQRLYDSYLVLNSIGNIPSNTENGQKYLEFSEKIGQNLFKNILPNEDPINFQGEYLSIFGFQMTEKYLCQYFFCEGLQNQKDETYKPLIYNFKKIQYNENPFSQDVSFQNYINKLKNIDSDLKIANYPIIHPTINSYENSPITEFPQKVLLNYPNQENQVQQKNNKTCLSKDASNTWTKSGCNNLYNEKYNTFQCICKNLSPTTVIDDLEDLLLNNNLDTAFSEDGLSNLAQFDDFYKYVAFWVLLTQTAVFAILYNKVKKLDKAQKNKNNFQFELNDQTKQKQITSKNKVVPLNNDNDNKQSEDLKSVKSKISEEKDEDCEQQKIQNVELNEEKIFEQHQRQADDQQFQSKKEINLNTQFNIQQESQLTQQEYEMTLCTNNSPQVLYIQNFDDDFDKESSNQQAKERKKNFQLQKSDTIQIQPQPLQIIQKKEIQNQNLTTSNQRNKNKQNSYANSNKNNKASIENTEIDKVSLKNNDEDKNKGDIIEDSNENFIKEKQELQQQNEIQQYQNNFKKLSKAHQILIFHNFFGIFFLYNSDIPRSLRLLIFYIRSVHSLAISVAFDQNYSSVQKIAIALINSISVLVVVKILSKLFSFKSKLGVIGSRVLTFIVLTLYYYLILSIVSGTTPFISNQFVGTFFLFYFGDVFVISLISALCQKLIADIIQRKKQQKEYINFSVIQLNYN